MEKIYFGDDRPDSSDAIWDGPPKTVDDLKSAVSKMSVAADFQQRGQFSLVLVPDYSGTSAYLSTGGDNIFWLRKHAERQERRGMTTIYYFKF